MEMDLNQLVHKDQTIKIVPSVEESLRNLGVNIDLDERVQLWFNHLRIQWKTWRKCPTTDNHFKNLFHFTTDPYRAALVCSVKCEEFKDSKPKSLPYFIIESLGECSDGKTPSETLKHPAFQIAISQRNQSFLKLVIKTYQVHTIKESILPLVKEMIKSDNCKLASHIVIAMELFDDIPVEKLLFPLILQDKANMIDEYLTECPNQVRPLLLFLDGLLDKTISIKDYAQQFIEDNKVCHVKYEKIHHKPLGKLVARLCNKFNIPIETCKNLSKNRTTGGLRYLIHQKYVEHNVSSTVWDDLVKDSLRHSGCAQEFIDMLVNYDTNEALKWASYFQLPENILPFALKNMSLQPVPVEDEKWDEEENAAHNFYKLPLPENKIIIIDTAEKMYDVITALRNYSIVSIDCEWKPSFGAVQSQVALIQIATFDYIYLIDTLILNSKQYSSFWYMFNRSVLDNAEIIKLGFGLEQDLKEIKASINSLSNIKVKGEGLLDLCLLWKSVINLGLSLPSNNEGNSLSSLVQACFGLPLEKAEQCSNWELRPLRRTQIYYAALDAYVLLEIYNYLQTQCERQKINFEETCNYVMLEQKMKTAKKKVADNINSSTNLLNLKKSSNDIQILVEHKLANLAAYLRYCNIDTVITSPAIVWHDIVNLALSENRVILTSKLKLSPIATFPQNSILNVAKTSIKDQLIQVLCSFNISVKPCDLLNICLQCNGRDLKKMTPDEVKVLCNKYEAARCSKTYSKRLHSDYDDDDAYCDNFLSDSDGDDILYLSPTETEESNKTTVIAEPCITSKGAMIDISNVKRLTISNKPATLCQICGKLYWDEDPLMRSVVELTSPLIDLNT